MLLFFANSVSRERAAGLSAFSLLGRAFAVGGLGCAAASALLAVVFGNLARKLGRPGDAAPAPAEAAASARRLARFGLGLNILGMGLSLVGAEAIVGTLAARSLTQAAASVGTAAAVQPIDVLLVQANTNVLASHFVSIIACLRARGAADDCEKATA